MVRCDHGIVETKKDVENLLNRLREKLKEG